MSRVLFVQNGEHDGPGLFAAALAARGVELETIHAWDGARLPNSPEGLSGLAFGGGGQSAYETARYPYLNNEMKLIREARAKGVPVLGMCLGAQLMSAALGGEVFPNQAKEIGFYEVTLSPETANDPLWRDVPSPFTPAHWHGDTFSLPPAATLLASSALTPNQLFRIDDVHYALQFHLEFDGPVLAEMIESDAEWLRANAVDPTQFRADAARHLPLVEPLARRVFTRWVELLPANTNIHTNTNKL